MTKLKEINIIQAINYALDHALKADNDVILLGQDIGKNGGVFRASINLENIYGSDRVIDMPLAENLIAGAAVGMACQGLKPIAELQFMGFIYPAIDQIINQHNKNEMLPRRQHEPNHPPSNYFLKLIELICERFDWQYFSKKDHDMFLKTGFPHGVNLT